VTARTEAQTRHSLVGAWELVRYRVVAPGVPDVYPLGVDAYGMLIYSVRHMSVQLSSAPDEATLATSTGATSGYLSYAGSYHYDGAVVEHVPVVALDAHWKATRIRREVHFAGERSMELRTMEPITFADADGVGVVEWRKLDR
jgi:lipocalin-like protein